jgi:ParB family chromosome partitioning protein
MSQFQNDSIFWIEVDKIKPNPYQPRREFDPVALQALADSIRQYGVLQALVVTRKEFQKEDGGLATEYELIAGERRLRASRLAGVREVPCLIKTGEDNDLLKLELAIIENVQREDLNAVDRARAFKRLSDEFGFKHAEIAQKVGKSREYVTNTLRLLMLPEHILNALSDGKITEGHSRPLMMLTDRPQEQETLFKEIMYRRLTVREAEQIARKIAVERMRKKENIVDPEIIEMEEKLAETLGTRVHIERKEGGGKVSIDFFSNDDLRSILELFKSNEKKQPTEMMDKFIEDKKQSESKVAEAETQNQTTPETAPEDSKLVDDRSKQEIKDDEQELYSIKNFSL